MTDAELLDLLRKTTTEDAAYSSSTNKKIREQNVVALFLHFLGIDHLASELESLEQASKADVHFRQAFFQVKELTDPEFKRHKMYKRARDSVLDATSLEEADLTSGPYKPAPLANMYQLVLAAATKYAGKSIYKTTKSRLDLLTYVTRPNTALIQENEIDANDFAGLGWRSVSCVNEQQAVVLFASTSAPEFIQNNAQRLVTRAD